MKRYTFLERHTHEELPSGKHRIYYDEQESTETVTVVDHETGEIISTDTYPVFTYRVADVEVFAYEDIIVALIRADYSADDELAIQRQKDDKAGDFNAYSAYVEKCKAIAKRTIFGDTIETAKAMKVADLGIYDASDAVNSFSVGGVPMWLSPDRRSNLKNAVEALKAQGIETVSFAGQSIPVDDALAMLAAIESYAAICSLTTDSHRAAIEALTTIEQVAAYDFTTGYPAKLEF